MGNDLHFGLEQVFSKVLDQDIQRREAESGVPRAGFGMSGGSKSRPLEDETWWRKQGPEQVMRWIKWRQTSGFPVWETPDGRKAIELDLVADLGEGVRARCVIDRVLVGQDGRLCVVDLKSGTSLPESALQLGIGACAIEATYGVRPELGLFFKTRGQRTVVPVPLGRFSIPLVRGMAKEWAKGRAFGVYPPRLQKLCNWCGFRNACAAYGGSDAWLYDPLSPDYAGGGA